MTRGRLISGLMLVVVASIFGGVYQFYFKEKLEEYATNARFKAQLHENLQQLQTQFENTEPDAVIKMWTGARRPWEDAVDARQSYFDNDSWYEHEEHPDDGSILRFWYDETSQEMANQFNAKAQQRFSYIPFDLRTEINVPYVTQLDSTTATSEEALYKHLRRLSFGISVCDFLFEHNITSLGQIVMWPLRTEDETKNLMNLQTVGLAFTINIANFIDLLEDARTAESYFTIDAIDVSYTGIGYPSPEPQLSVQMLLTQADYKNNVKKGTAAGTAPAGGGGGAVGVAGNASIEDIFKRQLESRRERDEERRGGAGTAVSEPGFFGRMWKLFKRYVLYTN